MRPSNPAGSLDIFGDIGGGPSEKHSIKLVDVDSMANRRRCHNVSKTLAKRQKGLAWARSAFRALHNVLDLGDSNAARDQVCKERQIRDTGTPLIPLDLVLQGFNNLVAALLVCDVGQRNAQEIEE